MYFYQRCFSHQTKCCWRLNVNVSQVENWKTRCLKLCFPGFMYFQEQLAAFLDNEFSFVTAHSSAPQSQLNPHFCCAFAVHQQKAMQLSVWCDKRRTSWIALELMTPQIKANWECRMTPSTVRCVPTQPEKFAFWKQRHRHGWHHMEHGTRAQSLPSEFWQMMAQY